MAAMGAYERMMGISPEAEGPPRMRRVALCVGYDPNMSCLHGNYMQSNSMLVKAMHCGLLAKGQVKRFASGRMRDVHLAHPCCRATHFAWHA